MTGSSSGSGSGSTRKRVFQVATGNVGSEMVRRMGDHPDLELVGLHCYTPDKIGRDAGEIVGIGPIGVVATGDVADIIAAAPDCVNFNGVWPDTDLFVAVLEAGINVVSTADWITGHHRDANHPLPSGARASDVIEAACRRGGSTFYGTGMNPGLANILSVVATAGMGRVDHISVLESVDVSCHHSVDTWKNCGYGLPVDDPRVPGMLEKGCTVFGDAIHLMADCLGVEIDEVVYECELGAVQEDVDLGWWQLPKGSVGASLSKFIGMVDGVPRIEVHLEWQMAKDTEPSWDVQGCYITTVTGDPTIVNRFMIFPAVGATIFDDEYFASLGMTLTGMPALHAIGAVCDARPGIITSADLPLRAFAGRFGPAR